MHSIRDDQDDDERPRAAWLTPAAREYTVKALVTGLLAGTALGMVLWWLSDSGLRPTEVSMSASGMSVKLARSLGDDAVEYLMVVSPHVGWQDTDIEIKPTDDIEFWASGHVNLSIFRVIQSAMLRRQLEDSIDCRRVPAIPQACTRPRAQRFRDSLMLDTNIVPEAFFTDSDYVSISPSQPWVDPNGDTLISDRSYSGRTLKKLAPALEYGRLIGIILPKAEDPDAKNANQVFGIGRVLESKGGSRGTQKTGDLWLAVNDVWNGTGKRTGAAHPDNLFMADNVGFFWVRITVRHK